MAITHHFQEYIEEQLELLGPVRIKRMFGGAGIYFKENFFAIIDDDTLYFKVTDFNRADYEAAEMEPFRPDPNKDLTLSYYEVPADVLENKTELKKWAEKALKSVKAKMKKNPKPLR